MAIQITVKPPLIFDVVYSSLLGPKAAPVYGEAFGSLVEAKKKEFDQRFEKVFQLGKKVCCDLYGSMHLYRILCAYKQSIYALLINWHTYVLYIRKGSVYTVEFMYVCTYVRILNISSFFGSFGGSACYGCKGQIIKVEMYHYVYVIYVHVISKLNYTQYTYIHTQMYSGTGLVRKYLV